MPVLGYNIQGVSFEKNVKAVPPGQIEVKISPTIKDLRLGEMMTPNGKVSGIDVLFDFEVEYRPDIAKASVKGSLLYIPPKRDRIDEILSLWEDEKKIDPVLMVEVANFLTTELSPMLMIIAKEMRVPYHVPLPRAELRGQ
ncbi:hypothetical protein [Thermococcus sp.]|uniref:hypothetical protein n=1 Tax=Thermococcus sp. TaxID=35749 RepID=UPI0026018AA4|nr:hypothetical protein [Thermococcus sp.]